MSGIDGIAWRTTTLLEKFSASQVDYARRLLGHEPDGAALRMLTGVPENGAVVDPTSNALTTAGLARLTSLLTAGGGQALTATACRLGVGDSSTVFAAGQTDLQASAGSTHRQFNVMDATYPSISGGVITFKATFATGEANFVWNEWCVDVGAPTVTQGTTVNALMLNRKVQALGTKASGSWALTATVTLS